MVDIPTTALGAGGIAIGLLSFILSSTRITGGLNYDQDRARQLHLGIYVAGAMLWPVVLRATLASCGYKGGGTMSTFMTVATLIPVFYLLTNALLSPHRHREGRRRHDDVRVGGSLIASVVFTAAMLSGAGKTAEASCKTKMLGIALVLSVLFVLASPDIDRTTYNGTLVTSMQNVVLCWGVGLFGVAYAI